ncbi:hypothetical protein F8S13_04035 [Chloroflexia bacterium SDU3-3]|nr:hypothetical protein F8S13_04035 [Chloroflexia bacterium SDU3-3]
MPKTRERYTSMNELLICCEWGERGVAQLAPLCDAVVIVDVLSFSTCVAVAVERGAEVLPYRFRDDSAEEYARERGALLAGPRSSQGYTLSPRSLLGLPAGARLVLPSPNGATLSLGTGATPTFAGCLRNAAAVARAAQACGPRVAVIPAGERWPDGSLRPGVEDQIGAGAIIHHMRGEKSPEAQVAEAAFLAARDRLAELLLQCASGRELAEKGFAPDVALAAELGCSAAAPVLRGGGYRAA